MTDWRKLQQIQKKTKNETTKEILRDIEDTEREVPTLQFHEETTKMKGEIILFKEITSEKS